MQFDASVMQDEARLLLKEISDHQVNKISLVLRQVGFRDM